MIGGLRAGRSWAIAPGRGGAARIKHAARAQARGRMWGEDRRARPIGRRQDVPDTSLRAVTDAGGRRRGFCVTAGEGGGHARAAAIPGGTPAAERRIADRGLVAHRFGEAPKDKGIAPRITGRKSRAKAACRDRHCWHMFG
jgi:hypothetical protein